MQLELQRPLELHQSFHVLEMKPILRPIAANLCLRPDMTSTEALHSPNPVQLVFLAAPSALRNDSPTSISSTLPPATLS